MHESETQFSHYCFKTLTSIHVFPATANDCMLPSKSFGLVNHNIFRPTDRNAYKDSPKNQHLA